LHELILLNQTQIDGENSKNFDLCNLL